VEPVSVSVPRGMQLQAGQDVFVEELKLPFHPTDS
jgi:hypothetical protein